MAKVLNISLYIAKKLHTSSSKTFTPVIIKLAIASIALSITVMLVSVCIMSGYKGEIHDKITGFASNIQILSADNIDTYESAPVACTPSFIDSIKKVPGVVHVQKFIYKPGIIKTKTEIEGIVLKGVTTDFNETFFKKNMIEGQMFSQLADSEMSKELIISTTTARRLSLKVGTKVAIYFATNRLTARPFKVVGIYETGLEEFDKTFALCDIRQLQKVNLWQPNDATGLEIYHQKEIETNLLKETIVSQILPLEYTAQSMYQLYPQIFEWLSLVDVNVYILLVLMAAVAFISMTTALVVLIIERTQMIGLLKALGTTHSTIAGVFLFLSGRLMIWGIVIGNIVALSLCWLQQSFHFFKLNQESYYMKWVPIRFPWEQIFFINMASFVICFASLMLPVIVISRTSPLKAIKFD